MQFKHAPAAVSAAFDDPNLVSTAGLVPMLRLAQAAGLADLARERLSVPTDRGANAGAKVSALVAGMLAGADSIDDMNLLRDGGMARLFDRVYAPSTLGSFLRASGSGMSANSTVSHPRVLRNLNDRALLLPVAPAWCSWIWMTRSSRSTGTRSKGTGFGYSEVRGMNALLATASTSSSAPVVLAQRLRKGAAGCPRGAARIVADSLATLRRMDKRVDRAAVLVRADSAFYGHATIGTAIKAGADVSVTVRKAVRQGPSHSHSDRRHRPFLGSGR